jgi:hypothetical protein
MCHDWYTRAKLASEFQTMQLSQMFRLSSSNGMAMISLHLAAYVTSLTSCELETVDSQRLHPCPHLGVWWRGEFANGMRIGILDGMFDMGKTHLA